jgi:uncharacterized protein YaaN involved in tellurite resistance
LSAEEQGLQEALEKMTARALSRRRWTIAPEASIAIEALKDAEREVIEAQDEIAELKSEKAELKRRLNLAERELEWHRRLNRRGTS